ncbi:hypothetical protein ACOMHN_064963 [Nucella lapillus]
MASQKTETAKKKCPVKFSAQHKSEYPFLTKSDEGLLHGAQCAVAISVSATVGNATLSFMSKLFKVPSAAGAPVPPCVCQHAVPSVADALVHSVSVNKQCPTRLVPLSFLCLTRSAQRRWCPCSFCVYQHAVPSAAGAPFHPVSVSTQCPAWLVPVVPSVSVNTQCPARLVPCPTLCLSTRGAQRSWCPCQPCVCQHAVPSAAGAPVHPVSVNTQCPARLVPLFPLCLSTRSAQRGWCPVPPCVCQHAVPSVSRLKRSL